MMMKPKENAVPRRIALGCVAALVVAGAIPAVATRAVPQQDPIPTFRGGVATVSVGATVRDRRGRLVTDLDKHDFEVLDSGTVRPITDFQVGHGGVSLAAVVDTSGSMRIGGRLRLARQAMELLFAALDEADEAALFAFDSALRELHPFTGSGADLREPLSRVQPFGSTSLHDAIAEAARIITDRPHARRAVLVVTDGIDTSSELSPAQVSGIASSVDVPIYILGIEPSSRATDRTDVPVRSLERTRGELPSLAQWTGGAFLLARSPGQADAAVRHVLSELRHQYLIGFEASTKPGWHPIEIRVGGGRQVTRARSFYWVEGPGCPDEGARLN